MIRRYAFDFGNDSIKAREHSLCKSFMQDFKGNIFNRTLLCMS